MLICPLICISLVSWAILETSPMSSPSQSLQILFAKVVLPPLGGPYKPSFISFFFLNKFFRSLLIRFFKAPIMSTPLFTIKLSFLSLGINSFRFVKNRNLQNSLMFFKNAGKSVLIKTKFYSLGKSIFRHVKTRNLQNSLTVFEHARKSA